MSSESPRHARPEVDELRLRTQARIDELERLTREERERRERRRRVLARLVPWRRS
jgi:hypothetical protein